MSETTSRLSTSGPRQFPCRHCGASLSFAPGTRSLKCPYCGTLNEIAADAAPVEELDYDAQLHDLAGKQETRDAVVVHCDGCGAESTLPPGTSAGLCPFCGRAIVAVAQEKSLIKPRSLLPFAIDRDKATPQFAAWLRSLWFAPDSLKSAAECNRLNGVYLPAWTYDCDTDSAYTGQRGDHYWDTETYTETVDGKTETRTRQVQRTRWYSASGRVQVPFDDVLVIADQSLPAKLRSKLGDWDLKHLCPFAEEYLSGFIAVTYQIALPDGFEIAKGYMEGPIRRAVETDIGGEEQRIDSVRTTYDHVTFKHVLLPVWISAYRFGDRTFHFVINGRTGRVYGERPYSAVKIMIAVVLALLLSLVVVLIVQVTQHHRWA